MDYKDYYKILGVGKKATAAEIKKAYRKLAVKYHPDKNQGDKKAEEKFKEVNEANEVLGNPEKRKQYDEIGENWKYQQQSRQGGADPSQYGGQPGGGGYSYEGDPSEFFGGQGDFSAFFQNIFGNARGGGQQRKFKGQNYQAEMELTLEEAYHGTARILQLESKKIRITTKPGSYDGQTLRIKGKGAPGINGGVAGDLYIKLKVAPHHLYQRKGDDLIYSLNVDLYTAILGGKATVNTFSGPVSTTIPKGIQPGKMLRLKSKGMPLYGKKKKWGDLLVKIEVALPQHLSEKETELFQQLRELQQETSVNEPKIQS